MKPSDREFCNNNRRYIFGRLWPVKVLAKRLRMAWAMKVAPWTISVEAVYLISLKRPPEYVFEYFRKLHGIDKP